MAKKPGTNPKGEFAFFNVVYEDGSQRSNRRVPSELLGGLDGDEPARGFIIEQDREIAEKAGRPPLAIKEISRVGAKKKWQVGASRRDSISPSPPAPVPGKQPVGKAIIEEARERQRHAVAEQRGEPALPRSEPPKRDRDIRADDEAASLVGRMQPPSYVIERGSVVRQRVGLLVDVPEFDRARTHCRQQPVTLPVNASIADRTAGVVPDGQVGDGHHK